MQTVTVELTHPHAFKLLKDLEAVQLLKIKPEAKPKLKSLTKKQKAFVSGMKEALHEVDLYMEGKIKLPTIDEVLNEI